MQGLGKGGAKRHRKILRDNIQGASAGLGDDIAFADLALRYHEARYPSPRSSWWCQAYLWPHLRGDPRCFEDLP